MKALRGDEQEVRDLELPLAQPEYSPEHVSPEYYYSMPVRPIYKSYPVYHPDEEPEGYYEDLQKKEPKVIWDGKENRPELKTRQDWIEAGEIVFDAPIVYDAPWIEGDHQENLEKMSKENIAAPHDRIPPGVLARRGTDVVNRGTGLYKVPSLKGVWHRFMFGHSGWAATLEDWFDPQRTEEDYVPTGWKGPPRTETLPVKGHKYGLDLSEEERKALIAFLRTLD